ncbi:hypothetical protein BH09PSE6_BH09PSE6_14800 [soil metagenome]
MPMSDPRTIVYSQGMSFRARPDALEIWIDDEQEVIDLDECRDQRSRPACARALGDGYVGFRDNSATPPFIELFTSPPTRFLFPRDPSAPVKQIGRFISRPMAPGFLELRGALEAVGAMTGDLS